MSQSHSIMSELPPEILKQLKGNGPYPSLVWALGGTPTKSADIPITAVFLVLYILGAVGHMSLFLRNKKRGHFFVFSGLLFGFCMARIVTCCLRLAWINNLTNISLGIAAQIFVAAGVLLIYIVNLFFTHRILRARHPSIGWHKGINIVLGIFYALIFVSLVMVITVTTQSFFTLSANTHRIDRDVQLAAASYLLFIALLPVPILAMTLLLPRRAVDTALSPTGGLDKFGTGRFRHQVAIVLFSSLVISLGAAFRLGTSAKNPVPKFEKPLPGYFSRACFYIFNFMLEIIVVYFYLGVRVDQRFHVPDGAKGPGSYSINNQKGREEGDVEKEVGEA